MKYNKQQLCSLKFYDKCLIFLFKWTDFKVHEPNIPPDEGVIFSSPIRDHCFIQQLHNNNNWIVFNNGTLF